MPEYNEIVPGTGAGSDEGKIVFAEEPKTVDTYVPPAVPEAPVVAGTDQGGYYTSKSRKLVDLFIGFFGLIALNASPLLFPNASSSTRFFLSQVTMVLSFVLLVMSFKMRRRVYRRGNVRDPAFAGAFRAGRARELLLHVLIPRLPTGGAFTRPVAVFPEICFRFVGVVGIFIIRRSLNQKNETSTRGGRGSGQRTHDTVDSRFCCGIRPGDHRVRRPSPA